MVLALCLLVLSACTQPTAQPTATLVPSPTVVVPTVTQTPEPTPTPTVTPTNTPEPTSTPTLIPFSGFLDAFRFYRTWFDSGKTFFYFLNAGISQPLYAKLGSYELLCAHDPVTQSAMKCESNERIEVEEGTKLLIDFFADPRFYQSVRQYEFEIPKSIKPIYSNEFDCPQRGQNVTCETEYRKYEHLCTTSITCYDACGYYYSFDNIPPGLEDPWVAVGSCP